MSDELLTVLSRRGQVAWPTCRYYIQELFRGRDDNRHRYLETVTLSTLQALGHVTADFTEGAGVILVAPRVLARLPSAGRPRAVLVGHRTTDMLQTLTEACQGVPGATATVTDDDDAGPLLPRRIAVEATTADDLAVVAQAVEARYDPAPPAWRILHVGGALEGYRQSLLWRTQRDVNWERRDFDTRGVRWSELQPHGDGLAEFTDPQTQRRMYRLRRADRIADVDRTWGCYTALASAARHVLYFVDGAVLVPLNARLPIPFEVGLALCSGYSPRVISFAPEPTGPSAFLRYRDVPRPLAELAAGKLGQRLQTTALSEASP
jgi:hypothetical protein